VNAEAEGLSDVVMDESLARPGAQSEAGA
jgi:hypothetical protein